jgi:glycosyltransferase involved in cell wall biosynthesis
MGTIDRAADRSPRSSIVVLVAAHNEAERIAATLTALERAFPGAALWVADDGSDDRTAEIASRAGAGVISGTRVLGKGAAMSAAARAALQTAAAEEDGGELLFILCDGDLGDSAAELAGLLAPIEAGRADLTVASFASRVGGGLGLALGFARWAIERRCGLRTTAPISGQRALRAPALWDVLPFADGYGMEIGMTIDAVRRGYRLLEVELELSHRASGRTLAGFAHRARQLVDFVRVYRRRAP